MLSFKVDSAAAMEEVGTAFAAAFTMGAVVYLQGELGAGKTTWVRGLLRGCDYPGVVRSPTFNLFFTYPLSRKPFSIVHSDLYRISDSSELNYLGLEEFFTPDYLLLVEWPERGAGYLPPADLIGNFKLANEGKSRILTWDALTATGEKILAALPA